MAEARHCRRSRVRDLTRQRQRVRRRNQPVLGAGQDQCRRGDRGKVAVDGPRQDGAAALPLPLVPAVAGEDARLPRDGPRCALQERSSAAISAAVPGRPARRAASLGKTSGLIDSGGMPARKVLREHQPVDAFRMPRRQHLRDQAAERGAEHMGAVMAEAAIKAAASSARSASEYGTAGLRVAPGVALIVGDHGEMVVQRAPKAVEHRMIGLAAVHQHERARRCLSC